MDIDIGRIVSDLLSILEENRLRAVGRMEGVRLLYERIRAEAEGQQEGKGQSDIESSVVDRPSTQTESDNSKE